MSRAQAVLGSDITVYRAVHSSGSAAHLIDLNRRSYHSRLSSLLRPLTLGPLKRSTLLLALRQNLS
jgi:hypothetical protein